MDNTSLTTNQPVPTTNVPIKLIKVQNRARQDFTGLEHLAESVKRHGLIHPVCVRPEEDGTYTLVAGECRLRAYLMAGEVDIPVTFRSNISDIQLKELELEENLRRKDFHWTETTRAIQQLDELKKKEFGQAIPGRFMPPDSSDKWTSEKTAELIGVSATTVSNDINLAKDIQSHPELAKQVFHLPKDMARKKLKLLIRGEALKKIVEDKKLDLSPELRLGDCRKLIKLLPSNSVDLLITDPPYGDETISSVGKHLSLQYAENDGNMGERLPMMLLYETLFKELSRVLKPGSHLYIFHAMSWYTDLHALLKKNGFQPDDIPLIWSKGIGTALPKDYHYVPSYEPITFAIKLPKGRPVLKPIPNVFSIPSIEPNKRIHPLQKPGDLLSIFINNSSSIGETILDPFAGSGSLLVEAKRLQRKAIGFEHDEGNFLRAQEYIKKG